METPVATGAMDVSDDTVDISDAAVVEGARDAGKVEVGNVVAEAEVQIVSVLARAKDTRECAGRPPVPLALALEPHKCSSADTGASASPDSESET